MIYRTNITTCGTCEFCNSRRRWCRLYRLQLNYGRTEGLSRHDTCLRRPAGPYCEYCEHLDTTNGAMVLCCLYKLHLRNDDAPAWASALRAAPCIKAVPIIAALTPQGPYEPKRKTRKVEPDDYTEPEVEVTPEPLGPPPRLSPPTSTAGTLDLEDLDEEFELPLLCPVIIDPEDE